MSNSFLLLLGIATPLIAALFSYLTRYNNNLRDSFGIIGGIVTLIISLRVFHGIQSNEIFEITLFNLFEGVDFTFRVTPLGSIFSLVASSLWIMASIYTIGYMRGAGEKNQTRFVIFYSIAIHAALSIAWSGNLLVLFIFYEILTFSTFPLVGHKQNSESQSAGRLYLSILVGTSLIFFLPAIFWIWLETGTLNFQDGGILINKFPTEYLSFLIALLVFGIGKAAIMPIHRWLPAAMVAPTPVSALLHAVAVVKAGVFSFLVVIVYIVGPDYLLQTNSSDWLVWLACFTIMASSIIAITKDDLKARLAYSTISQLSYIILGAALASSLAIKGASFHIITHALGKITLFFCAGAIYVTAHIKKVSELKGLGFKLPLIFVAYTLGALSIIGVPPFIGSWSKFYLIMGSLEREFIFVAIILGVSSLLNIYYLLQPVVIGFTQTRKKEIKLIKSPLTVWPPVITGIGCLILFFYSDYFIHNVNRVIT
ncbi:MAG: proton-conducting transporter membrane subunit [Alphaproteobacteria bacterium]|jgi:multicomponent Na+:H+ antiporter subunit D|tara:strand:+ start:1464 stop:2912 length:1449 start_codon:yes stop_codon:yes gene_type:complete